MLMEFLVVCKEMFLEDCEKEGEVYFVDEVR